MKIELIKTFRSTKDGGPENEDAFECRRNKTRDGIRAAVCDGATESAFAASWSRILAEEFASGQITPDQVPMNEWLEVCRIRWEENLPEEIPWHGQAKTQTGALSTLLGITATYHTDRRGQGQTVKLQAKAVGDSNLFIIRNGTVEVSFPIEESSQFDSIPDLICSNPANNKGLSKKILHQDIDCEKEDLVIMASDAIACWFLEQCENGGKPWETLLKLTDQISESREETKQAGIQESEIKEKSAGGPIIDGITIITQMPFFSLIAAGYPFYRAIRWTARSMSSSPDPEEGGREAPVPATSSEDEETWEGWLKARRREKTLKTDDTTLAIFKVS